MHTYMSICIKGITFAARPPIQTSISANICRIYTHTCIYMYTCKHIYVYLFQRNQLRRGGRTAYICRWSHRFFWNLRGMTTHVYTYINIPIYPYTLSRWEFPHQSATHSNSQQHTGTRCNTLQHAAIHCNSLQHTTTYQHIAHLLAGESFLDNQKYTATHGNTLRHTATCCNMLQHIVTRCNTLQQTTTHYNIPARRTLAGR